MIKNIKMQQITHKHNNDVIVNPASVFVSLGKVAT